MSLLAYGLLALGIGMAVAGRLLTRRHSLGTKPDLIGFSLSFAGTIIALIAAVPAVACAVWEC